MPAKPKTIAPPPSEPTGPVLRGIQATAARSASYTDTPCPRCQRTMAFIDSLPKPIREVLYEYNEALWDPKRGGTNWAKVSAHLRKGVTPEAIARAIAEKARRLRQERQMNKELKLFL